MESEEETFNKIISKLPQSWYDSDREKIDCQDLEMSEVLKVAKLYFEERIKQLTPSDEAIEKLSSRFYVESPNSYKQGFKKAIELLTKNK